MKGRILAASCAVHFLVDLSCMWLMCSLIAGAGGLWYLGFLLYNFCAFALQLPIGMLLDEACAGKCAGQANRISLLLSAAGCALLVPTALFAGRSVFVILGAGLANALFHIGCGADLLRLYDNQATARHALPGRHGAQGIFVPAGGFGLFVGALLPYSGAVRLAVPALLLCSALLLAYLAFRPLSETDTVPEGAERAFHPTADIPEPLVTGACMFLAAALHSTTELSFSFSWESGLLMGFVTALCAVFGKIAGGLLSDRFGIRAVFSASLCLATLMLLFADAAGIGLMALLAYHMSMPLFFSGMYDLFPGRPAFAYGLVKAAIFAGYVPVYAGMNAVLSSPALYGALTLFSLLLTGVYCLPVFQKRRMKQTA